MIAAMLRTGLLLLLSTAAVAEATAQTKLLRYPDIHGDKVVFVYAGDLWTANVGGGAATRITTHPGLELFPKFSPDGTKIAFTGQYDGDEQVYVVDAWGGEPKQLSYYPAVGPLPDRWGFDNQIYGWSADGSAVLFRSLRQGTGLTDSRLYTVPLTGGLPVALPMKVSGAGDFSPDGKYVVFSPLFRDFRTWKRYEGGWAQDLYTIDLGSLEVQQITNHARTDRDPMWIGDRIYFSSDRDDTLNLYYYDTASGETHQVTQETGFDVRWPSKGGDQIVYELGGELHVLDTASGESRAIVVSVPTDALAARSRRVDASDHIEDFGLSSDGARAVFAARGDIFTVPAEKGPTRNLTQSSDAHDKHPAWSPDGSQIAFLSDRSGEEELYLTPERGGELVQLTQGGSAMRYQPVWSPDGERIAFSDKDGKLFVLEVESKKLAEVADEARGQVRDYSWSPCSGHLTFSLSDENRFSSIYIWSVVDGQTRRITGELWNEFEPVFSADGDYLFYLTDHSFAPQIGSIEWNYIVNRETVICALALREDVEPLFPPESDETEVEDEKGDDEGDEEDGEEDDEADEDEDDEPEYAQIDFDGLADRVALVPVEADNFRGLTAVAGRLLYVQSGAFYYGRGSDQPSKLTTFSLEDREESTLAEGVGGYSLSADGAKLIAAGRGGFQIYETSGGDGVGVPTGEMALDVDPREEWRQIFAEVWRRYRDFFYVANLHGYDWDALREQYEPLLDHVYHRSDLNYVIGEMIAELNVGHAYIAGGDREIPDRAPVGLPGAVFELDEESGRYRIVKIFRGQNAETKYRAPLSEIGVDAREGDYVLAIDGVDLTGGENPYRLLRHRADHPVRLTLATDPEGDETREASFEPIEDESNLVYLDEVEANRRKVDELTNGRVGYLHVPDMSDNGIYEFIKWFYGQIRKEGLVIDVRTNGGGNTSQMFIERLRRTLLATGYARTQDTAETYPEVVFHGHLVAILDEDSASDGDIFPAMFKEAKLGPLVGKRSWGGVTGITNRGTLIDGGTVFVPEYGFTGVDGAWIIEGYGVDPDIEVDNDPKSLIEGRDPQLERAVEEVLKQIRENPKRLPNRLPPPVKTKREG